MIRVRYEVKDDSYRMLECKGHAEYGDKGKDLICASASSIMFGLMNALDELNEDVEIIQTDNSIRIMNRSVSETVENYIELAIIQLKTIEESYGNFIKVERK